MRSYDTQHRVIETLDAIERLLDDQAVAERIHAPIDRAMQSFRFTWEPPFSHHKLLEVVGDFVSHVQSELCQAETGSTDLLQNEGIWLLTRHYPGVQETGYDEALLDATASFGPLCEGIDVVLTNLGQVLKTVRQQDYSAWVYARYLDPFDHELLRAIVLEIQERNRDLLPQDLLAARPFELCDQIPHLLDTLREARAVASRVRSEVPDVGG